MGLIAGIKRNDWTGSCMDSLNSGFQRDGFWNNDLSGICQRGLPEPSLRVAARDKIVEDPYQREGRQTVAGESLSHYQGGV